MISSVLNFKGQLIDESKVDINEWVYNIKIISKNKQFSQVFFNVASIYGIRALTKSLDDVISKNKLRISIKKRLHTIL